MNKQNGLLNLVMDTDSYKPSQWIQYPENVTAMYSYFEARGGYSDVTVFFGLQYILKKYFEQDTENPDIYIISKNLREKVSYQKHDLLSLNAIGYDFDLIICKHVLQHFNNEEQVDVIKMFYNSLENEGFLLCEYSQELPEYLNNYFVRTVPEKKLYRKTLLK